MIFVRDIEKWLDLKIITFLTTPLYACLVSTRTLQVCEITSSTTEIKEIFHNPAGSLLRGPPDDPSDRKIYLKLRSIQSEERFLALDLAPRRSERKRVLLEITQRVSVCAVSCASIPHAHVTTRVFAVASILTHTHPHPPPWYIGLAHARRPVNLARRGESVDEAEERERERVCIYPAVPFVHRTPEQRRRPMESRIRGGAFGVGQHGSSSSCSPAGGHSAEEDPLRTSLVDTSVSTYCSSHVSLSRRRLRSPTSRQKFHDAVTHVIRTG